MHRKSELTPNSLEEPQFDAYVTKAARHLSVIHGQMSQASDNGSDPLDNVQDLRKKVPGVTTRLLKRLFISFNVIVYSHY